jgi:hypothetical protein
MPRVIGFNVHRERHVDYDPDSDFDPEAIMTANGFNCTLPEQSLEERSDAQEQRDV